MGEIAGTAKIVGSVLVGTATIVGTVVGIAQYTGGESPAAKAGTTVVMPPNSDTGEDDSPDPAVDPCLVGRWERVKYPTTALWDDGVTVPADYSGSTVSVVYNSNGTGTWDGDVVMRMVNPSPGVNTLKVVSQTAIQFRYAAERGSISYSDVSGRQTETSYVNGELATEQPGDTRMTSDSYQCGSTELTLRSAVVMTFRRR